MKDPERSYLCLYLLVQKKGHLFLMLQAGSNGKEAFRYQNIPCRENVDSHKHVY